MEGVLREKQLFCIKGNLNPFQIGFCFWLLLYKNSLDFSVSTKELVDIPNIYSKKLERF